MILDDDPLPDHSCPGHEKMAPSERSCWPTCSLDSTCPNYSHTSAKKHNLITKKDKKRDCKKPSGKCLCFSEINSSFEKSE